MTGLSLQNTEIVDLVEKARIGLFSTGSIVAQRPDVFNAVIRRVWPGLEEFIEKLLISDLTKLISEKVSGFAFQKLDFGNEPPVLSNIKLYNGANIETNEIIIDVDAIYAGNMVINASWNRIGFGLQNIRVSCALRIRLATLLAKPPFFSCISLSMLKVPVLDFEATGFANIIDFKPVKNAIHSLIEEKLLESIVMPNSIIVPLDDKAQDKDGIDTNTALTEFRCRLPRGLLQVLVVEANSLASLDLFSKNDAFVRVAVGADLKRTASVKDSNEPRWHEALEFDIRESAGAIISVQLLDDDTPKDPESIGFCSALDFRDAIARVDDGSTLSDLVVMGLGTISPSRFDTKWYPLHGAKDGTGQVRLGFRYYDYVEKPELLRTESSSANTSVFVYVHSLQLAADTKDLIRVTVSLRSDGELLKTADAEVARYTTFKRNSRDLTWDAFFRWRIPAVLKQSDCDARKLSACFTVNDEKGEQLGSAVVLLGDVLRGENLRLVNKSYPLDSGSTLRATVAVRYVADYSAVNYEKLTCAPRDSISVPPSVEDGTVCSAGSFKIGRIKLSFMYDEETGAANVIVLKCCGLVPRDGVSSYSVMVRLLPAGQLCQETVAVTGSDASFNQLLSFPIKREELSDSYFCVSVRYNTFTIRLFRLFTKDRALAGEARHVTLNEIRAAALKGSEALIEWLDLSPTSCDNC